MPGEDEFLRSLRATFQVEAGEHLQVIAAGLLELERTAVPEEQRRLVEEVFRAAHSLKGAARAVSFVEIESICQSLEEVFSGWKRRPSAPSAVELDSVHRTLDTISHAVSAPREESRAVAPVWEPPAAPSPPSPPGVPAASREVSAAPAPSVTADTVRIAVAKLDERLLEAEEMLTAKLAAGQRASDFAALAGEFEEWRKEWVKVQPEVRTLRPDAEQLTAAPELARLVDFFDWSHDYLRSLENKVATLRRTAEQDHLVVSKLVDDLLVESKKLLMLPLATMGALFPKVVRDLCRDQGKEADLVMRGDELEIDKRILEEMKDPLIHLLRNCVDHGIESPVERRRLGKSPRATITLAVSPVNGNKVELLISDDGAGIDTARVKASAIKHGRIDAEKAAQLGEAEAIDLIFQSEVSTSPIITQISGRGLGLAIVREKAAKLGGSVSVTSQPQQGTTIRIALPIALATFRGILVEAAQRLFVIPTTQVERVARFRMNDVRTVEGRETLTLDGRATSLVSLAQVLELPEADSPAEPSAMTPVILLGAGDQRVAFAIDRVLGEQEVLVKRLGKPLVRVRNVAGATVLGSGQVVPILSVPDLLKSARRTSGSVQRAVPEKPVATQAKAVLIAEDSITSRMLLKSILESAGYRVKTAVDGMEAFTLLRAEHFDLLVSDVEMPRLNGFALTARVRADRKLAELPVVLVTALETREDRERGIDVGANAYLIKSSFDQSNLLETVRRLI